jgi:hypothetical protein
MSQNQGSPGPGAHAHGALTKSEARKLHRDWRVWAAVGVMLGCMLIYILTLDESIGPNTQPSGGPPATNSAPAPQ